MTRKAVVLLSGGLDSATVLAIAKEAGFEIYALSFRYGQRNYPELKAAEWLAKNAEVKKHLVMQIDMGLIGGSALTDEIEVPKGGQTEDIPVTYVPARNTIFLSFALGWAEVIGATDIFIGVNALDYSGYPDCRPEFIEAFEKMANLATKVGVEGKSFRIHTPLIDLTKGQIIKKGVELGVDYGRTHSCYDPTPEGLACGSCDTCLLRKKGFADAGVADPTRYIKEPGKV
ncbi:MAG: 7-cyano-7-deazaguanine synthase [Clostridiales bacterium]|jgi:7-cyano-7-deazaguanine synthase|nr:7-cyano-7-deazaguanine synthase [Clostridiales bacterium]MDN5283143.1 7-cyano-7-deazaguanine synthase [Candidatus Ozemobacter sp.]